MVCPNTAHCACYYDVAALQRQLREARALGEGLYLLGQVWVNQRDDAIQRVEMQRQNLSYAAQYGALWRGWAEAAEAKLLQGGTVVFTGLSVPKRELDEAKAEQARESTELWERIRAAEALVEAQQENEVELVNACIWNLEQCPDDHCNDVTRVHDRLLKRRKELAQEDCTCGGVLRHPCGPKCLAPTEAQEEGDDA